MDDSGPGGRNRDPRLKSLLYQCVKNSHVYKPAKALFTRKSAALEEKLFPMYTAPFIHPLVFGVEPE